MARLEISQKDVDVLAEVLGPDGEILMRWDTPVARGAPERFCYRATMAGTSLRLSALDGRSGPLEVKWLPPPSTAAVEHDCAAAAERFQTAEARRSKQGWSAELAGDYQEIALLAARAHEPQLATLALRQAAWTWQRVGDSLHARELYQEALQGVPQLGAAASYFAVSLQNQLGLLYLERGDLHSARERFTGALERARTDEVVDGEASALNNLGRLEESAGRLHAAVGYYQQASALWARFGDEASRTRTVLNLAEVYGQLEYHRQALDLLEEALDRTRRRKASDLEANLLLQIGWIHHLRGHPADGILPLRQALEIYQRLGDRRGEIATLDRLGSLLLARKDFEAAHRAYERAFAMTTEPGGLGNPRDAANTASNLACLFQSWQKEAEAASWLVEARRRLETVADPRALAHLEFCAAHLARQQGDLDAALAASERCLAQVDALRTAARRTGALTRPIGLWQDYAELHLTLLMSRYRASGDETFAHHAFEASDLARARNAYEMVLEAGLGVRQRAAGHVLEHEDRVRRRLDALEAERRQLLSRGAPETDIETVARLLAATVLELEEARQAIRASAARAGQPILAPRPVRLEQVQDLLATDTRLLSFFLGRDESYLFLIGPKTFAAHTLPPRERIEMQAEALYRSLAQRGSEPLQSGLTARHLAGILLPTTAREPLPGVRRLIIAADGLLNYLPFALLPASSASGGAPPTLWLDRFEISYVPSAAVLAALRQRDGERAVSPPARDRQNILVFADPIFAADDPRLRPPEAETARPLDRGIRVDLLPYGPLPRLPFTRTEAEAIRALLPSGHVRMQLGWNATRQNVLEEEVERFDVLHFATHARIDERFPELSGIVLSQLAPSGQPIEGELRLHEIYGLRLAARLVVLSGCQTALGQQVRGDGILGLTRGFFYAGSSRLLVSLWSVHDEATAFLMTEFYRALFEEGKSPTAALRQAQSWMRRQDRWNHPYYWAAFVLQGSDS